MPRSLIRHSLLLSASLLISAAAIGQQTDTPRLSSATLDTSQAVSRLAFGSCFKVSRGASDVWDAIRSQQPQLFLFAGDTVYPDADEVDPALPSLHRAYGRLSSVEPFTRLRETVPVLPVWDDHDFGVNDGGADYPARRASEALFENVWDFPADDPRRAREGVYHAVTLGEAPRRLQVIVLDLRSFRSPWRVTDERGAPGRERYLPDEDPGKTLLGADQWAWLERELAQPAELRLMVSSIQVLADGHGWERWGLLPVERERLFTLLRQTGSIPTLLLSGDRHVAGFYQRDIGVEAPLFEFTSSALNNTIPPLYRRRTLAEAGPHRLGALYGEANFGALAIDWEARRVALTLHGRTGDVVRRVDWDFDAGVIPEPDTD